MNDPSSTEVEVVQLTEEADGLYVFAVFRGDPAYVHIQG